MTEAISKKLDEIQDNIALGSWTVDDRGVTQEKEIYKGGKVVATTTEAASPIPILPTALLENVDSNTEKLELSFYKHNRWQTLITERSVTANRNSIIKLADRGIEVNSDNAGMLVKYIADVVAWSLYCLPHKAAKSVMGWIDGEFMPYTDKVVFDGDDQFKHLYKALSEKGSLAEWTEFIKPLRTNKDLRLCMAASFASPLIELIGENPFVFHLWGGTGAGKTIALMIAMSIWGDPSMGKMTRTMNMTANSMLTTAAFLRNLPFAGDELQTIKSRWTNYDNLIMCITEGIDRGRMSYDKVNEVRAWKCSFIFSGEEPCIKQASGGGAKNRVIEVECKGKLVENGNLTANYVRTHYGCAGKPYIDHIKTLNVAEIYSRIFAEILSSTDTTDKQAGSMALILTADSIASKLFWTDEQPLTIECVKQYLCSAAEVDVTERAYEYVCGAIAENRSNFSESAKQSWGNIEGNHVYINKTVLSRIMDEAGFDFESVKTKWDEKGYIERNSQGRYAFYKSINGVKTSYVKLSQSRFEEDVEPDKELPFND